MTLSNLIRKGGLVQIATATPATLATQEVESTATVAQVATVAVAKPQPPATAMTADEETAIRAWLAYIAETSVETITEVLDQCRADMEARAYFLQRAEEVPPPVAPDHWAKCGECQHFRRIDHPNLGHCASGEPEAIAGLWDIDRRWCESFERLSTTDPDGENGGRLIGQTPK